VESGAPDRVASRPAYGVIAGHTRAVAPRTL
jgi:hypothetical protein